MFIEVKTRTSNEFGTPAESVNKIKEKHIYQVSRYFLYRRHLIEFDTRIDVIEILLHNGKFNINHIKQVL